MNGFYSAGTLLGLEDKAIIAVIGCGGKTSLIASLANEYRHKKVLVTPTTKMFPIEGIQCLGILNEASGKLEALKQEQLEAIIPQYDLVLLEADGSAGLPCKGWLADEPVVPAFCTHTIGVVT